MADNVTILDVETRLDIPATRVLEGAQKADLAKVLLIGLDKEGELYISSTTGDKGTLLLLMEWAKKLLLDQE